MDPTRWQRVEAVFHAVVDLPAEQQESAIVEQCGGDAALAAEVRSLLAHDHGASAPHAEADPHIGMRLGGYEVTGLIARGGMAGVYDARRADGEFEQRVAIKIMDLHLSDPTLVSQFRAERQILAALEHPAITRLLDGGVTAIGEPYLVMEFVEGEPLDRYCDSRRLDVPARLRLFADVCEGIAFAHGNLVLHRDLKPSNILVTPVGRAKIVDFGTATLLQPDRLATTSHAPLTPAYASPEQLLGGAVGTASDQYSLGLVLFELLSGASALGDRTSLISAVERALAGPAALLPHQVVTESAAQARRTTASQLKRSLSGDVATILAKALAHEPNARYASVQHFADDLQRWQAGRPIVARPDSLGYRARKFIGRRKLETAAAALAMLAIVGGLAASLVQARRAEAQSRRAEEVLRFLTTMLGAAEPESLGKDVTVRQVLDKATKDALALESAPALAAEVHGVIGRTFIGLGEYELAQEQLRQGVVSQRRATPNGSVELTRLLGSLSAAYEWNGQIDEARRTLDEAAALLRRFPEPDAMVQFEHLNQQGRLLFQSGNLAGAIPVFERARALGRERTLPPQIRANVENNLAVTLSNLGRHREATTLHKEAIEHITQAVGRETAKTAEAMSPYASALWFAGEREQALAVYEETVRIRRKVLGPEHPDYAWTLANYADSLVSLERYRDAEPLIRDVLALRGKTLDDAHPIVAVALQLLGRTVGPLGRLDEGERWLRESLAVREKALPPGHWALASSRSVIGGHLVLAKRFDEAEPLLLDAEQALLKALGEKAPVLADARRRVVDLYQAMGRSADADRWRAKLRE